MTARPGGAELVESREILPGQRLLSLYAPAVATGARAGQFVHVLPAGGQGLVLRPAFPISTADPASGTLAVQAPTGQAAGDWVSRLRPGDDVVVHGPFGRAFEVDPRSRHLLLVADGSGIAGLRLLADEAVRAGRQVTLLLGAPAARHVYPSTLLPDEVEYVVSTDDGSLGQRGPVTGLVPAYEAWADQAFACGPPAMLAVLARLAATRRQRLGVASLGRKRGAGRPDPPGSPAARRRAFLQVALEHPAGCALATCLGCVVMGQGGTPQRVCREGPAFASDELDWEAAPA